MKLTKKEIQHIATLARLELTEEEISMYSDQLSSVLSYMDILQEVNTDGVEETTQVTGLSNVMREDTPVEISEEERKKLLASFPEEDNGVLKVKAVFADE